MGVGLRSLLHHATSADGARQSTGDLRSNCSDRLWLSLQRMCVLNQSLSGRISGFLRFRRSGYLEQLLSGRSAKSSSSSRERTLVDCLRHPQLCGGIRPPGRDDARLPKMCASTISTSSCKEATKAANGAAWKRLGYLAEILWPNAINVLGAAREHISAGYSSLDPAIHRRGRLVRRWNLWINTPITTTDEAA